MAAACIVAALGVAVAMLKRRIAPGPGLILLLAIYWLPHVYTRAGGDGVQNLAVARSLLFDRDLELENDYAGLQAEAVLAGDGRAVSAMPIGTALVFLPLLGVAHAGVVVASLFGAGLSADGFSPAYAAVVMRGIFVLGIGSLLLLEARLRPRFGAVAACLAVAAAWLATSLHYYLVVNPSMTHAPQAVGATLLFLAWLRAREMPVADTRGPRAWLLVGACGGTLALVRPQDAVLLLLPLGDLLLAWRPRWKTAARVLGPALALAMLQVLTWLHFHGASFVDAVSAGSFVGRTAPAPLDVLFSARHGLVTWTPAAGLALLGLVAALRRERRVAWLCLLGVTASVVVNGAMQDWWGSDSFGQRRLVGLTPLFAFGLAHGLAWIQRRPLLAPALFLAMLAAWNVAFTGIFNARRLGPRGEAVSLDRLATAQLDVAHRNLLAAERFLPRRMFFFLYDNLRGVYVDEGPGQLDGVIDLGSEPQGIPVLGTGWGEAGREGERTWRRARGPRSDLRVPVRTPGGFDVVLEARATDAATTLHVLAGGEALFEGPLSAEWTPIRFRLPAQALSPGFNEIALEWRREGEPVRGGAADVDRIGFDRPRLGRKGS